MTTTAARRAAFGRDHPETTLLQASEPDEVAHYLVARGVIGPAENPVRVAAAGDGNMNCTLRVITPHRRFIVKQARPWVEKYDHIPAPWNRSHVEAAFYETVASVPGVGDRMPRLIDTAVGLWRRARSGSQVRSRRLVELPISSAPT